MRMLLTLLLACSGGETGADLSPRDQAAAPLPNGSTAPTEHPASIGDVGPVDDGGLGIETRSAPFGEGTARLTIRGEVMRLVVENAKGTPVTAQGDVQVVYTPHEGMAEELVLQPSGKEWSGPVSGDAIRGTALVTGRMGRNEHTTEFVWGSAADAPAGQPTEAPSHEVSADGNAPPPQPETNENP